MIDDQMNPCFPPCPPVQSILVDGKPHIGTDRLVRLLRHFRTTLSTLGVDVRFGCCVEGLQLTGGGTRVAGVRLQGWCLMGEWLWLCVDVQMHGWGW